MSFDDDLELTKSQLVQKANYEKEKGNQHFKKGNLTAAADHYSRAITCDPKNPIIPCNRAMAYLKLKRYEDAKSDCDTALTLDPSYIKALFRRGLALKGIGSISEARLEFEHVLKLEPANKLAADELNGLNKAGGDPSNDTNDMHPSDRMSSLVSLCNVSNATVGPSIHIEPTAEGTSTAGSVAVPVNVVPDGTSTTSVIEFMVSQIQAGDSSAEGPSGGKDTDNSTARSNSCKSAPIQIPAPCSSFSKSSSGSVDAKVCSHEGVTTQTSATTFVMPPSPKTSYQFMVDWTVIQKQEKQLAETSGEPRLGEVFATYLMNIEPSMLPKIFQSSLEIDVLTHMLIALAKYRSPAYDLRSFLDSLIVIPRVKTLFMLMSQNDESNLQQILDDLKSVDGVSEDDIEKYRRALHY